MKCPYCDTEFELETLKDWMRRWSVKPDSEDDLSGWQTDAGGEWQEGETDGMNVYTCQFPVVVRLSQMRIQEHQIVRIVEIP